ncbi:agmatinase [Candidatus Poribacteria bacterium]|nr:agmatinase [Candidatus Poribacteria bacterium]
MGIRNTRLSHANVIIIPVPYEATVTYGRGTAKGPKAIIEASKHVEFYSEELDCEPHVWGFITLPELRSTQIDDIFQHVYKATKKLLNSKKLIIILGGEHSVTPGAVAAFADKYSSLSVLQLDAHADLRDQYMGSKYNHACSIRRILEHCPAVQVGIRSLSYPEKIFIQKEKLPVFFMQDIKDNWIDKVIEKLTENVYITLDVDAFDPSIMPSTGTPEPGGLMWDNTLDLLKQVAAKKNIVGFDVVELSPQQGNPAPDFLTAKLIYKLIGYIYKARENNIIIYDDSVNLLKNKGVSEVMEKDMSYILQITDFPNRFKCAVKVDPNSFNSIEEMLDKYVKNVDAGSPKPKSRKNLNVIQDCIYKINDDGQLLDLYEGLIIRQDDNILNLDQKPEFELYRSQETEDFMLLDIVLDRSQITEEGNPYGYNIRKWMKNQDVFENFVYECLEDAYGSSADRILELTTVEDCKRFLKAVGKRMWEADFELYSRFIGDKLWFKDPSETLLNIIAGRGGTCTEKSSAMKMISDVYGFNCEYLLGGPGAKGPFPEGPLREMLETLDFELGKKFMIYWEHMALLYDLETEDVMMDIANGNVPFIFMTGYEIEDYLQPENKKSIKVKMVLREEEFYYHVVPQDIPQYLLEVMQDWIDDIDLIHVFHDGLGLLIREDYYIWPLVYRDEDEKMLEYQWWMDVQEKQNYQGVELLDNFSLPGMIAEEFKKKYPQKFMDIVEAYDYLIERYNDSYFDPEDERRYNLGYIFLKLK